MSKEVLSPVFRMASFIMLGCILDGLNKRSDSKVLEFFKIDSPAKMCIFGLTIVGLITCAATNSTGFKYSDSNSDAKNAGFVFADLAIGAVLVLATATLGNAYDAMKNRCRGSSLERQLLLTDNSSVQGRTSDNATLDEPSAPSAPSSPV